MSEHLTRKELKTDHVALTVESAFDYFEVHRKRVIQIGAGILIALLVGLGGYFWWSQARATREEKLSEAMAVADAQVGPGQGNVLSYPTQQAKDTAVQKAFSDIAAQYGGDREGAIAEYTLAGLAVSAGHNDEARKRYEQVLGGGGLFGSNKEYKSLAQIALAQLDFAENKDADGERRLRDLMNNPTAVVSKEQATVTLARLIAKKRPAEAKALVAPLTKESGEIGQIATSVQNDLQQK